MLMVHGPSTSCKIFGKLMSQSWKKSCHYGQTHQLGLGPLFGKQQFSQRNSAPSILSAFGLSTSCRILKKLIANPEENAVVTDKWTKWAILSLLARFQASNNFPKKFGFVSYGFNFKLELNYWLYFKNEIFLERKSLFPLW